MSYNIFPGDHSVLSVWLVGCIVVTHLIRYITHYQIGTHKLRMNIPRIRSSNIFDTQVWDCYGHYWVQDFFL